MEYPTKTGATPASRATVPQKARSARAWKSRSKKPERSAGPSPAEQAPTPCPASSKPKHRAPASVSSCATSSQVEACCAKPWTNTIGATGEPPSLAPDAEARHAFMPKRMPSKSKPRVSPETSLATSPPFFRTSFATFDAPLLSRCGDSIDCTASLNYFSSMCVGFSERATESERDGKATPI